MSRPTDSRPLLIGMFTKRPAHEHGGVERVVREITTELQRQNSTWTVATVSAFHRSGGIEALDVASDVAAAVLLAWRAVRGRFDAVFVHCPECLWGPLLARWLTGRRPPLIAVWHGAGPAPALVLRPPGHPLARALAWFRSTEERLALHADAHVAVHQSVVDDLRHHYGFTEPVTIAENALGGPVAEADGAGTTAQPRRGITAVWVGQSGHRKGLDVALGAVAAARRQRPDIALRVVGVPPGDPAEGVTWCGVLAPSAVADVYRGADVLLFPTRYESFGLVVLEAMGAGLPVIVSHAVPGGIVEDGRNGIVVHGHAVEDYAAALVRLRDDEALRRRFAEQNRRDAGRFDIGQTARVYAGTATRVVAAASA